MARLLSAVNALLRASVGLELRRVRAGVLDRDWFDRLLYFRRLLTLVDDVDGDVVECGVADGQSLAMLAALVRSGGRARQIWGLDSWRGLPQPHTYDLTSPHSQAVPGMFSRSSLAMVRDTLDRYGLGRTDSIRLLEGWFSATLPLIRAETIAILHIDADLYASYTECLDFLWPKVSRGGLVAFDEYRDPAWPGATRAIDEFLARLPRSAAVLHEDRSVGKFYVRKIA